MAKGFEEPLEEFLDVSDVGALVDALGDSSVEVRIAAFEALTRLALSPPAWSRVADHVAAVLRDREPTHEVLSVIDSAPWVPVPSTRELLTRLAQHGEGAVQQRAAAALGSLPPEESVPAESSLRPVWADGPLPGFTTSDDATLDRAVVLLEELANRPDHDIMGALRAGSIEPDVFSAVVTLSFVYAWQEVDVRLSNDVVALVAERQGRFRPDGKNLFDVYRAEVKRWAGSEPRVPAFLGDVEDPRRWIAWQVAWTVSRGGIKALVHGMGNALRSSHPEVRLAACCLIADAAAYVVQPFPALFGGGSGPRRPPPRPLIEAIPPSVTDIPVLDDDVQFSLYRPRYVRPARWYPLLAFVHRTAIVEDPETGPIDPVAVVEQQARALLEGQPVPFGVVRSDSEFPLPRGTELLFEVWLEGGGVNPDRASVRWEEPVHRLEFRVRAPVTAEGRNLSGGMRVFMGALLVGEASFRVAVTSTAPETDSPRTDRMPVRRYRKIFASYSHADTHVVEAVAHYVSLVGDQYLIDARSLRSGERWEPRLAELIEEADVFQLFWSTNAMASEFVRSEWEYALTLRREAFIRPVYWEEPLPTDIARGLPPAALRQIHFSRLAVTPGTTCPTCGSMAGASASFCAVCGRDLGWAAPGSHHPRPRRVPTGDDDWPEPTAHEPTAPLPPPLRPTSGEPPSLGPPSPTRNYARSLSPALVLLVVLVVVVVVLLAR